MRVSKPLSDDLGSRFFTGGHNPKPKKKPEKKDEQVHYTELDRAHWLIQRIYGSQDA